MGEGTEVLLIVLVLQTLLAVVAQEATQEMVADLLLILAVLQAVGAGVEAELPAVRLTQHLEEAV
jgi:hypothetical protein